MLVSELGIVNNMERDISRFWFYLIMMSINRSLYVALTKSNHYAPFVLLKSQSLYGTKFVSKEMVSEM